MENTRTTTHPTEPVEFLEAAVAALEPPEKEHYDVMLAGFRKATRVRSWPYHRKMIEEMLAAIGKGQDAGSQWTEHHTRANFLHPVASLSQPSEKAAELALRTVMGDVLEVCDRIDALKKMEPDVRAVVNGLGVKARTVIGVLVELAGLEGLSCGLDFGHTLLYSDLADDDTIKAGFLELADDPDIATVAKAYRMAGEVPD